MTVSHLTRSRDRLWSDLLVALGGSEAFLTRSISERKVLLEILGTYSSSVPLLTIDDVDALLAAVVNAAGGTASHLRQNKHEMLAALVTALGGTAPSASSSSTGELLAACVNAVDTGGGGGGSWLPEGAVAFVDFVNGHYYANGAEVTLIDILSTTPVITANGMEAREGGSVQAFTGDFLTALLDTTSTFVLHFKPIGIAATPLVINDAADNTENPFIVCGQDFITVGSYSGEWSFNFTNVTSDTGAPGKVAYTRNGSHEALSGNGGVAEADETVPTLDPVPTRALIGHFNAAHTLGADEAFDLYSITVYPPQLDAALPALSAL